MEECLGPVGQLVGMVVRTAVTFADTVNWMQDNMLAAQKVSIQYKVPPTSRILP